MRDRLNNEFQIGCVLSKLRVAYKEAAFASSELKEVYNQKIKGNPEFFELEGFVDSSVGEFSGDSDGVDKENIKEGEIRFTIVEHSVMALLHDKNIIELAFFEEDESASLFKHYSEMRF